MTLAAKLGKDFAGMQDELRIRTIRPEIGGVAIKLRVKVPLKVEWESAQAKWMTPADERVEKIYQALSGPLREAVQEGGQGLLDALKAADKAIEIRDDDVISNGHSVKLISRLQAIDQIRHEVYFAMLVSETADKVDESYEQITAELTLEEIKVIMAAIDEAINPSFDSAKKNSTGTGVV